MQNRWTETAADPVEQLVYQSRLVGMEEDLVLWGGGNNSLKASATDLLGRPIDVMYIKSSGSDMKSIVPRQFPAVRLDYIAPLRSRDEDMSDQEMVDYLAKCLIDPASARPSIETLLHAFLPARAVLHTHADAILALTNTKGREETVRKCFGEDVIIVGYKRPGVRLSRDVADAFDAKPHARGLVLMNHGLITWGDSVREAYDAHIELVTRAERFGAQRLTGSETQRFAPVCLGAFVPRLRGALAGRILEFDSSPDTLAFLAREDASRITQVGPATPDHLLYTKRHPLFLQNGDDVQAKLSEWQQRYKSHYDAHPSEFAMLEPMPLAAPVTSATLLASAFSVGRSVSL
jgi:rhamnose utilization protein RhaD (predicted bifunctional aldolase and dehydrogenase)